MSQQDRDRLVVTACIILMVTAGWSCAGLMLLLGEL